MKSARRCGASVWHAADAAPLPQRWTGGRGAHNLAPMTAPATRNSPLPTLAPATGSPLTDAAVLAHLLDLAGPSGALALLDQISTDLQAVQVHLSDALHRGDSAAIRSATHILMSLAGTVGAPGLHAAARDANLAAHAGNAPPDPKAAAALMADLSCLIDDIARRRAGWTSA